MYTVLNTVGLELTAMILYNDLFQVLNCFETSDLKCQEGGENERKWGNV